MESFFEKNFNPANVNRFTYDEIDAVDYYTGKRQNTFRLLVALTVNSVVISLILLVVAMVARLPGIVFLGGLSLAGIAGLTYRGLRSYYWNNFCLKTVHRYNNSEPAPAPTEKLLPRLLIAQGISMAGVLVAFSISLLVPPPPTPPPAPTITPTPSITYTPSITFTPSMTFTPSITPTPTSTPTATHTPTSTSTPTQVVVVDSPRPVAVYICPQVSCEVLAVLDPDDTIIVVQRDAWIEVELDDGRRGFIPSFLVSG